MKPIDAKTMGEIEALQKAGRYFLNGSVIFDIFVEVVLLRLPSGLGDGSFDYEIPIPRKVFDEIVSYYTKV